MSTSNTNAVSYTNDIGQVINPGDEVVIVTTGYSHSVYTYRATYIGLHKNGGAQCIKKVKSSFYAFKDTGERVQYTYFTEMNNELEQYRKGWVAGGGKSYEAYQQPEYKEIRQKFMNKVETKYEYRDSRTTLKLNRVYKLAA